MLLARLPASMSILWFDLRSERMPDVTESVPESAFRVTGRATGNPKLPLAGRTFSKGKDCRQCTRDLRRPSDPRRTKS